MTAQSYLAAGALDAVHDAAWPIARRRGLDPHGVARILGCERSPSEREAPSAASTADDLGGLYAASIAARATRKRRGAFYTSRALIAPTVARTLAPLLARGDVPMVCDPAAGGGAFLLEALRAIAAAHGGGTAARRRALDGVFGVDVDEGAVRVARLSLWLEVADPELDPDSLAANVRHGDALVGAWDGCAPPPDVAAQRVAFDWRRAFPTVFARGGFDAVVGNPPWEIDKPDSRRFFAAADADYARRDKQDALRAQRALLAGDPALAERWRAELDAHRAFARWVRSDASPFRHQGRGDANLYKLFTERAWQLLRDDGRLGLILPSGIYTDAGSAPLRDLLLRDASWEWLFGFENRRLLFPIDNRCKFAIVIAQRGGPTREVRTAFLRHDPRDWEDADVHALATTAESVRRASPRSLAFPELRTRRERDVLEKILAASHPLGDELDAEHEGALRYLRELDQTADSHRFPPRTEWEARGFRRTREDRWVRAMRVLRAPPRGVPCAELEDGGFVALGDVEATAIPVWEGRMIGPLDFSAKGWVAGRGRRAQWREIPFADKRVEPQFLLAADELSDVDPDHARPKLGFMAIASATNARSMVAASLLDAPCGNSVPTLRGASLEDDLVLLAVLNSFAYDFALRTRLGGTNLNQFVLAETPVLPPAARAALLPLVPHVAALAWPHGRFAPAWQALGLDPVFALDAADRTRRRALLDAAIAAAFGLDDDDLAFVLRDCDLPTAALRSMTTIRALDPKGFWRVDRTLDPDERHTVLTRHAFADLTDAITREGSLAKALAALCARGIARRPEELRSPAAPRSSGAALIPPLRGACP